MQSEVKTVKSPFFNRDIARQLCQRYSDRELEELYKIKAIQTFRAYARGLKIAFKCSIGVIEDYPDPSPICKFNFTYEDKDYLITNQ